MSKVEIFETEFYSDEDGWKVWLVTERVSWDNVTSYFKCQYPDAGVLQMNTRILEIQGYQHNINTLGTEFARQMYFINMVAGTENDSAAYTVKFTAIMMDSMSDLTMLKTLKEHNLKMLTSKELSILTTTPTHHK